MVISIRRDIRDLSHQFRVIVITLFDFMYSISFVRHSPHTYNKFKPYNNEI